MTCGGRHYCPTCDEELIHRDHRQSWESASALGQIIHRMKRTFTFGDIDGYTLKRTHRLLRFIEHKQPDQALKFAQGEALAVLDRVIAHYVACQPGDLNPQSGVYVMRGPIDAATTGRRETRLAGPQVVTNARLGEAVLADEMALFAWLDCDGR